MCAQCGSVKLRPGHLYTHNIAPTPPAAKPAMLHGERGTRVKGGLWGFTALLAFVPVLLLVTALLACVPVLLLVEPPKKRRNVAATMDDNEWGAGGDESATGVTGASRVTRDGVDPT